MTERVVRRWTSRDVLFTRLRPEDRSPIQIIGQITDGIFGQADAAEDDVEDSDCPTRMNTSL